jgi:hypothetical protein
MAACLDDPIVGTWRLASFTEQPSVLRWNAPEVRFAIDSALEGTGFELPVRECNESGFAIAVAAREELKVCRLVWGFFCQVVFWFVAGSLFGGVSR